MLFCQRRGAQAVKVFCKKNTLFGEKRKKGRFFFKNPKGLTLTDKRNELILHVFLNFENTNKKGNPQK